MRKIKNGYKIIIAFVLGICVSVTSVYAVDAYIESKKVSYDNTSSQGSYKNVQESIDELYERSGIHKEKWIDPVLNGADPVLKDPLIPVDIKPNGDVYYANLNSEWYNYSEKRWANAIILVDNPSNKNYKVGDHILEDDIESYFVWIPRYKYKIWNMGSYSSAINFGNLTDKASNTADEAVWKLAGNNAIIIEIEFGLTDTKNTDKECKTINISGDNGSCEVGKLMTHPAFTLGDKNLNGIWVGKFETARSSTSITDGSNIIIKPNIASWRNETVKTFFDAAKGYETLLDSHMMKNTEWGAIVYLSHSKYGISSKININNSSDYKTGYGAAAGTDQNSSSGKSGNSTDSSITKPWNKEEGYLASTTGNISGIYDMAGGAYDYVAACIEGNPGNSGFDEITLAKYMQEGYVDKYVNDNSVTSFNRRILGDATGEMGPFYTYYGSDIWSISHSSWYGPVARMSYPGSPWLHRGGFISSGINANQFQFDYIHGGMTSSDSFRLALAPTN